MKQFVNGQFSGESGAPRYARQGRKARESDALERAAQYMAEGIISKKRRERTDASPSEKTDEQACAADG